VVSIRFRGSDAGKRYEGAIHDFIRQERLKKEYSTYPEFEMYLFSRTLHVY